MGSRALPLRACPSNFYYVRCSTLLTGSNPSTPSEQKEQKDDHQDQAQAAAIVVVGRTGIETTAAEKKNQDKDE
jgi:hypothetical protein